MQPLMIEISCPDCNHKLNVKVAEMVPGSSKTCPHCGCRIQFTGDDGRKVQKGLDNLERAVKKLSRRLKSR